MANKLDPPISLEELSERATSYALGGNWDLAVKTNRQILSLDPKNLGALNRLGFAFSEIGKSEEAATTFRKVLRLDPYNTIATKNLNRLKNCQGNKKNPKLQNHLNLRPEGLFLEEPGRTATVAATSLTDAKVLLSLNCADPIKLVPKSHQLSVTDQNNRYLGKVPDVLAARLLRLIKGGNTYEGCVKSFSQNQLHIFLRETNRAKRFASVHSFPIEEKYSYVAFTPPDLVHNEQPETRSFEDQDSQTSSTEVETEN